MASATKKKIRLVVFDFDGVFTDNRVLVFADGTEAVYCTRADGLGLNRLKKMGLESFVLSSEKNPVVGARCRKLGIECFQDADPKLQTLKREIKKRGIQLSEVCYVGNDVNDIECLRSVGFPVVVADADHEVKRVAKLILKKPGGHGAVRELCDQLWVERVKA